MNTSREVWSSIGRCEVGAMGQKQLSRSANSSAAQKLASKLFHLPPHFEKLLAIGHWPKNFLPNYFRGKPTPPFWKTIGHWSLAQKLPSKLFQRVTNIPILENHWSWVDTGTFEDLVWKQFEVVEVVVVGTSEKTVRPSSSSGSQRRGGTPGIKIFQSISLGAHLNNPDSLEQNLPTVTETNSF